MRQERREVFEVLRMNEDWGGDSGPNWLEDKDMALNPRQAEAGLEAHDALVLFFSGLLYQPSAH